MCLTLLVLWFCGLVIIFAFKCRNGTKPRHSPWLLSSYRTNSAGSRWSSRPLSAARKSSVVCSSNSNWSGRTRRRRSCGTGRKKRTRMSSTCAITSTISMRTSRGRKNRLPQKSNLRLSGKNELQKNRKLNKRKQSQGKTTNICRRWICKWIWIWERDFYLVLMISLSMRVAVAVWPARNWTNSSRNSGSSSCRQKKTFWVQNYSILWTSTSAPWIGTTRWKSSLSRRIKLSTRNRSRRMMRSDSWGIWLDTNQ